LLGETTRAIVVLSRVRKSRPLKDRIEIWRQCAGELLQVVEGQILEDHVVVATAGEGDRPQEQQCQYNTS
jgi:hypothetical protein